MKLQHDVQNNIFNLLGHIPTVRVNMGKHQGVSDEISEDVIRIAMMPNDELTPWVVCNLVQVM